MAPSDSDEVAALRAMGLGRRPAWDGSPLRARPAALKGLQPITREPWAIDEDVYNRRFETRDVGVPDRYLDKTARKYESAIRSVASHNAFNMKYEHGTKYGAGGILGGDNVRTPEPAQAVPRRKAPVSSPGGKPRAGASGGGGSSALTQSESLSPAGKARGGASGSAKGLGRKYVEPKSGDASPAHKKRAPLAHDADPIRLSFPGAKPPPPAAAFAWPHKPTSWIPDPNAKYGHYRSSA